MRRQAERMFHGDRCPIEDVLTRYRASCPGTKYEQTCQLRPAVIKYPARVQSYSGAHSLHGLSVGINTAAYEDSQGATDGFYDREKMQLNGYDIVRYQSVQEDHSYSGFNTASRLAGLEQALNMYLEGKAEVSYDPSEFMYLSQDFSLDLILSTSCRLYRGPNR
jgi:hypothetical protein